MNRSIEFIEVFTIKVMIRMNSSLARHIFRWRNLAYMKFYKSFMIL